MKKLIYIAFCVALLGGWMSSSLTACSSDDDNEEILRSYMSWRDSNNFWLAQQTSLTDTNGEPFYTRVTPQWNTGAYILMHWFNNREETAGNLSPLFTSTVKVSYIGRLYNDAVFDSSYTATDGARNFKLSGIIAGWQIALMEMKVGDSVQIVVPATWGYGASTTSNIPPYSALRFNMKLVDIPYYEIND